MKPLAFSLQAAENINAAENVQLEAGMIAEVIRPWQDFSAFTDLKTVFGFSSQILKVCRRLQNSLSCRTFSPPSNRFKSGSKNPKLQ